MKAFSVEHVIQVFLSKIIHMEIVFRVKTNLTFQNTLAELWIIQCAIMNAVLFSKAQKQIKTASIH